MYEPHFIMDYQVFLDFQTQNLRIKYCNYKVVVVTVNYRLGPWGELSLDSGRVSGNQGLRDQVCHHLYTQLPFVEGPGLSISLPNSPLLRDQCDNQNYCSSHSNTSGFTFRCWLYSGSGTTLHILEEIPRRSPFGARALELGGHFDYNKLPIC